MLWYKCITYKTQAEVDRELKGAKYVRTFKKIQCIF